MTEKCEKCGRDLPEDGICTYCKGPPQLEEMEGAYPDMDQDDLELLDQLRARIKGLEDEIENEVDTDIDDMYRRVDGVVRTVKRLESIDQPTEEDLLYAPSERMPSGLEDYETADWKNDDVSTQPAENAQVEDLTIEKGHIPVNDISPYGPPDGQEEINIFSYDDGMLNILENLIKLIGIKRTKGNLEEAWNIVSVALEISPENMDLQKEISLLEGLEPQRTDRVPGAKIPPREESAKTMVLLPELESEIGRLEAKAKSSLDTFERLMKEPSLPKGRLEIYSNYLNECRALYDRKMFSKANEIALIHVAELQSLIKEGMDNQIQENLDRARDMVEDLEKGERDAEPEFVSSMRERFDTALKCYLTDDYSRANLLSLDIIRRIMDFTHPESMSMRGSILEIRKEMRGLAGNKGIEEELSEIDDHLMRVEGLLKRRELDDASRVLESARKRFDDLKELEELRTRANEIYIKLTNHFKRLEKTHDVSDAFGKMDYLDKLMDKRRFDDILVIANDIQSELDAIEKSGIDRECKEMLNEIDSLMPHVEEMEDPASIKKEHEGIVNLYLAGEHSAFKQSGKDFLERMRRNIKIIAITRARRICASIIDSKIMLMKLRHLNMDTSDHERRLRKAKNHIKDHNYLDGLAQMDSIIKELNDLYRTRNTHLKRIAEVHGASMDAILDRYREEPPVVLIKKRRLPLIRKSASMNNFRNAIDMYEKLVETLDAVKVRDEIRKRIESDLAKSRFEMYRRKDEGYDISEPLSLFSMAQKRLNEGKVLPAEYYLEMSKRYCEDILVGQ
ncbi:MAG: hypothetical protein QCI82_02455 [Candidatus Thermoplasmatota archaeon]|nr:hypothetical protein [Candidatus Thermoplasmatota archaeon]